MEWKTDPNKLAWKMLAYIEKEDRDVPYAELETRAITHGIDLDMLDSALSKLHKFQKISQRVIKNEIVYSPAKPVVKKDPMAHLDWVNKNYPYPKDFVMPFPEIDMSYLFLTPEEADRYKAEAKGRPYIPKKRYQKKAAKPAPVVTAGQQMMLKFNQ